MWGPTVLKLWSAYERPNDKLRHALLHPNYLVGTFSALFNADTGGCPVVVIWAEFLRDADTTEVSRLMQFDLRCITRLFSCEQRDLMPIVWAQSIADTRKSSTSISCTPGLSKRVAQLADVIAIIRPTRVELSPPPYRGRPQQLRNLEIVSVIKKPSYPHQLGSYIDVDVESAKLMITADAQSTIRSGQEYVFFLQFRNDPNIAWIALYPCGILTVNDPNLAMAREATASAEQSE